MTVDEFIKKEGSNFMGIRNEIDRIKENIANAYVAIKELGGEIPEKASGMRNSANLEDAIRSIPAIPPKIYGATWNGSSTTVLTRTDDAAGFAAPTPAVGTGTGTSPFNNIMPWSGMVRVSQDGNELVAIPKYWVKVSHNPFKVQIANRPVEGYQVSPAHRDREDGQGERDVVYIGRYECDDSFMSRSGQVPRDSTSLTTFRNRIHSLGAEYWQADYALHLTLWFLYIVEFADWNSQTKIGLGRTGEKYASKINTGGTDSMTYHTGRAAGTNGETAVQYRWIENPWGNLREWRDGIIFSDENISTYNNPANFCDIYAGPGSTARSNKRPTTPSYIKSWGYDANDPSFIYPSAVGNATSTADFTVYIPDACNYGKGGVCGVNGGGVYGAGLGGGLFQLAGQNEPSKDDSPYIGSRIQKLPNEA